MTLRETEDLQNVRILLISGVANKAEVDALMAAGADAFIKKPFNIANVIERIMELVEGVPS